MSKREKKFLLIAGGVALFFYLKNKAGYSGIYGYFDGSVIESLDDLKKRYFQLAKIYHPDVGGNTKAFQDLQNEYEKLFHKILNGGKLNVEEKNNEVKLDENLRAAFDSIVNLPGIRIELAGKWIWVSGNTYPIRNELKKAGFHFAPVKKTWYYAGTESGGRGDYSMEEIRNKFGSEVLNRNNPFAISGVNEDFLYSIRNVIECVKNRAA